MTVARAVFVKKLADICLLGMAGSNSRVGMFK